jgi:hypothetical protein
MMTEQLTKNLLVRLIKEEIEKTQLDEATNAIPSWVKQAGLTPSAPVVRGGGPSTTGGTSVSNAGTLPMTPAEITKEKNRLKDVIRKYQNDIDTVEREYKALKPQNPNIEDTGYSIMPNDLLRKYDGDYPNRPRNSKYLLATAKRQKREAQKRLAGFAAPNPILTYGPPLSGRGSIPLNAPQGPPLSGRGSSRGGLPRFLRKYKQYIPAFETEFGGVDKKAFRKFYSAVGMPQRLRDFVFGRGHFKYFQRYVDKITPAVPEEAPVVIDQKKIDAVITRAAVEFKAAADFDDIEGQAAAMARALRVLKSFGIPMDPATRSLYKKQIKRLAREG